MIVEKLPMVLRHSRGSISMERAIKNVLEVLKHADVPSEFDDRFQAAIDDLETMLEKGFE